MQLRHQSEDAGNQEQETGRALRPPLPLGRDSPGRREEHGETDKPGLGQQPDRRVMFAASLPISMGGWGLRELSAVVALQLVTSGR